MSYVRDLRAIRRGAIDDGTLAFSSPARATSEGYEKTPLGA
jgi:hypothetical protein